MRDVLRQVRALAPEFVCEFQIEIKEIPVRTLTEFEANHTSDEEKQAMFLPSFHLAAIVRPPKADPIYSFADLKPGFDVDSFIDCIRQKLPSSQQMDRLKRAAELRKQADAIEAETDLSGAVG